MSSHTDSPRACRDCSPSPKTETPQQSSPAQEECPDPKESESRPCSPGDCRDRCRSPNIETAQQASSTPEACPVPEKSESGLSSDNQTETAPNEARGYRPPFSESDLKDLSPTVIHTSVCTSDILSPSLSTNLTNDDAHILDENEGNVTVEDHDPGTNDFMSGAVRGLDTPLTEEACNENNFLLCPTLLEAQEAMPFKMLKVSDLQGTFPIDLADEEYWDGLPDNFYIPVVGLVHAVVELQSLVMAGHPHVPDVIMIRALAKRGGTSEVDVVYPRNLKPLIGMDEPDFDFEFWSIIWDQAD